MVVLTACHTDVPDLHLTLSRCADMPVDRASSACFVMGDRAYVFAGRDTLKQRSNEIWCYCPATDSWALECKAPVEPRVKPIACVVGDEVYLGLGFNGRVNEDTCYLRDFWRYSPSDGQWKRLADYPSNQTDAAVGMTDGKHIFVCYGAYNNYERNVYVYDIAADQWQQMPDATPRKSQHPPRAFAPCGAQCGGRFFIGTGYNHYSRNFWVELLPFADNIWEERAALPGQGRNSAACTASDDYVYVAGGRHYGGTVTDGFLHEDILRYSPAEDRWTRCATLPCGPAENMVAFRIGKSIYVGLGNDRNGKPLHTLYRMTE